MNKERSMTAFYLETVLMVIIFVLVILLMTRVLGLAKLESSEAQKLNAAVSLSQNAAEAVAAAGSEAELLDLLNEDGSAALLPGGDAGDADFDVIRAGYDSRMQPDYSGELQVRITWQETSAKQGVFVDSQVSVYDKHDMVTPVVRLDTGHYIRAQAQEVAQ